MQTIFKNHEKLVPVRGPVRERASVSDLDPDPGFQDEKFSSWTKIQFLKIHGTGEASNSSPPKRISSYLKH
jgi:hypothetical protein